MVERIAAVATWWPQTMSLLALAVLVAAFTFSRAVFSGTQSRSAVPYGTVPGGTPM